MKTTNTILQKKTKQRILSNTLIVFMVAMVFANVASEMYMTMLPLYMRYLGADVVQIGIFFTVSQIIPLILQVLGGWVSDTIGRLRSVALGSVIGLGAFISPIFVPTWQWLYLTEGLNAMTRSLIGPSFGAFIAEETSEEHRGKVYGMTDTIYSVVTVIGPPLAGWLADTYGFRIMLTVAAAIYICATIIRVFLSKIAVKRHPDISRESFSFKTMRNNFKTIFGLAIAGGVLTWLLLTDGVRDIAFSLSFRLMPVYLEDIAGLNLQQIGWLTSFFGIAMMLTTIPAGWFADRFSERAAIALGFILEFVALIMMINLEAFIGFAAAWIIFGVGVGLLSPAYQSLLSKALPERLLGTGFGLIHASLGIFSLPAPAFGSFLWKAISPQAPFYITAVFALITVIPAWLKFKLSAHDLERAAQANGNHQH
ncbi:MAG: putative transporter [Chloroflexi bacterium ADurb.Bin120]|jgi:MFS family permease|uniref:Major facilitator superfamily transporter n=1 Tax=Candidatus Brevifilum fermentans TaxID=1986204 RepID=A0A1Y6K5L2_9CHLR|nr:MFS transporter [Brevefilum fermentans]MDI9566422.1 MFS transporter [Chloroflexota bacterium]OQB82923.1 MAG: putative transporter [Chloroflexi bacterium ADurb.Bin120]SMX54933.1 Major facilitator superfamily transporter [Brevefilum fermentans]HOM67294.1 MFS transporter [Brevefilum fermentans]HPX94906.1 MFS transporter [Brevefilum fermentans]